MADGSLKKDCLILFLTGLSQVMFVAINTYMVAHRHYMAAFLSSFAVSLIWTMNVKRAAFGGWWHRLAYAGGAALGTLIGMTIVNSIYK